MKHQKKSDLSAKSIRNQRTRKSAGDQGNHGSVMVGIGASAGGIPALNAFFEALPGDTGMAFTVIMHLDPDRESELAEVLQGACKMPVTQVTESVAIVPDHVYVIPPNRRLLATENQLSLATFDEPRGQRSPIDQFFRSLAAFHENVVGIILSGSGTDGTVGIKEIKERGGVLMVQSPSEAEFDTMPQSAIATGLVDMILPAGEIARQLVLFSRCPVEVATQPDILTKAETGYLEQILRDLCGCTGHDFMQYKRSTVLRRITRRMQVKHLDTLEKYINYLRENFEEVEALFKELLIGVTSFFRDPDSWDALATQVVPKLFEGKDPGHCVRAWVVGSSTGEEAYSLGMLLLERASRMENPPGIQIFATDLDEIGLTTGRRGVYPDAIRSDLSAERLDRFFIHERDHYRVKSELRDIVLFATHNVLRDPPFSQVDLITCRNLLIYLEHRLQNQLIDIFHYALLPRGFLFLGSSETIGSSDRFRTIDKQRCIHQAVDREDRVRHVPALSSSRAIERVSKRSTGDRDTKTVDSGRYREIFERYGLPSILVDENLAVVNLSETAGRYLLPPAGPIPRVITKLVRPALQLELQGALRRAFRENEVTLTIPVKVPCNGDTDYVRMLVRPNRTENTEGKHALVIFIDVPSGYEIEEGTEVEDNIEDRNLEAELRESRRRLQTTLQDYETTTEELKAANEELQSINEEFHSTNEELETSKEELQSVNEELHTVNAELKEKYEEVSQAHSDLYNLFVATDIATLILDRELRIKRFTPRLRGLFNIMPTDAGRPVSDLTHTLVYDNLLAEARGVLADLTPFEREVRDTNGSYYLLRIFPYRTVDNKIDGVVMTFVDVTRFRKAEEELRKSEERYRIFVENVREYAIFMLDPTHRITTWNAGSERLFEYGAEEAIGSTVTFLLPEEDREYELMGKEFDEAKKMGQFSAKRVYRRKDGKRFQGTGVVTALYDKDERTWGYAMVIRDNTERLEAEEKLHSLNKSLEEKVRQRTEQLRTLCASVSVAEQRERSRVSQILHDDLQQLLYAVSLKLEGVADGVKKGKSETVLHSVQAASDCLEYAVETTRKLTFDLNPPVLKEQDFVKSLVWLTSYSMQMLELRVELVTPDSFLIPDEGARMILFDSVREALFNAVKHGKATHATVRLEKTEKGLRVDVEDTGRGFDRDGTSDEHGGGYGLSHVKEQIALFGGEVRGESMPGDGCRITFTLPSTQGED